MKRITKLPVPKGAKLADLESPKATSSEPDQTRLLNTKNSQKENTKPLHIEIKEVPKTESLSNVKYTELEHTMLEAMEPVELAAVGNKSAEYSQSIVSEQSSASNMKSKTTNYEISTPTEKKVSDLIYVPNIIASADTENSGTGIVGKTYAENDQKVLLVCKKKLFGNTESLSDANADSADQAESSSFEQTGSKPDKKYVLEDNEKVHEVAMNLWTDLKDVATVEDSLTLAGFEKAVAEIEQKMQIVSTREPEISNTKESDCAGNVETLSHAKTDSADVKEKSYFEQNESKPDTKYISQDAETVHMITINTSTDFADVAESILNDAEKVQSDTAVRNADTSGEEYDDGSMPASPFRAALIGFDSKLTCSPDPHNPMLKNLLIPPFLGKSISSFGSSKKHSQTKRKICLSLPSSATSTMQDTMNEQLNVLGDMAGNTTLDATLHESGCGNTSIASPQVHVEDCSIETSLKAISARLENGVDDKSINETLPRVSIDEEFHGHSEDNSTASPVAHTVVKVHSDDILDPTSNNYKCDKNQINASASKPINVMQTGISTKFSNKTRVPAINVSGDEACSPCQNSIFSTNIGTAAGDVPQLNQNLFNQQMDMTPLCDLLANKIKLIKNGNSSNLETGSEQFYGNISNLETGSEQFYGNISEEEMCNRHNTSSMNSLQNVLDREPILQSSAEFIFQPADCNQNRHKTRKVFNQASFNICTEVNKGTGKEDTNSETILIEEADPKARTTLCDFLKQSVSHLKSEQNFFTKHSNLDNKQTHNSQSAKSVPRMCGSSSQDKVYIMHSNKNIQPYEVNQSRDRTISLPNKELEKNCQRQKVNQAVEIKYCDCSMMEEGIDIPVEQVFVLDGQMYQLPDAQITRIGNLEFYAFFRDGSLHIPLGNLLRAVGKEVRSMFESVVNSESLKLHILTQDEICLLEQKSSIYYDSTNKGLLNLGTLQEICVQLLNISPDDLALKMLAFSRPYQRVLGTKMRCSTCGMSKRGQGIDKTYIPVDQTGVCKTKVGATVGTLKVGDVDFTSFELNSKPYISLKEIVQHKIMTLKTMQDRMRKINSKAVTAPADIEEYFSLKSRHVGHTLWIDMVTFRCVICMGIMKLKSELAFTIARGDYIYDLDYNLLCEDTSQLEKKFVVNPKNGEVVQGNKYKKFKNARLPFTLAGKQVLLAASNNVDYEEDHSVLENGSERELQDAELESSVNTTYHQSTEAFSGKAVCIEDDKNKQKDRIWKRNLRQRKKKEDDVLYYFFENSCDDENQEDCESKANNSLNRRKNKGSKSQDTSQISEAEVQIILQPGDYIVSHYDEFCQKLEKGHIVMKRNGSEFTRLQSEEKQATTALESVEEKEFIDEIAKENEENLLNQAVQISGISSSSVKKENVEFKTGSQYLETGSSTKNDRIKDVHPAAQEDSAVLVEKIDTVRISDEMSWHDQTSSENDEIKHNKGMIGDTKATTKSLKSSENICQQFIEISTDSDFDTVKESDGTLMSSKESNEVRNIETVTDCKEHKKELSSHQEFSDSQMDLKGDTENCSNSVSDFKSEIKFSLTDLLTFTDEMADSFMTYENPLLTENIHVQQEMEIVRKGYGNETNTDEKTKETDEDKENVNSYMVVSDTQTGMMECHDMKENGANQVVHNVNEQSVTITNSKEEVERILIDIEGTYQEVKNIALENLQHSDTVENGKLENNTNKYEETKLESQRVPDREKGRSHEEMRREMEENITKYLVFMYVKDGNRPGFRVKKFLKGAEKVFPALFLPDPEHPVTKLKRIEFVKAAAKYMDDLFHYHKQRLRKRKQKTPESSDMKMNTSRSRDNQPKCRLATGENEIREISGSCSESEDAKDKDFLNPSNDKEENLYNFDKDYDRKEEISVNLDKDRERKENILLYTCKNKSEEEDLNNESYDMDKTEEYFKVKSDKDCFGNKCYTVKHSLVNAEKEEESFNSSINFLAKIESVELIKKNKCNSDMGDRVDGLKCKTRQETFDYMDVHNKEENYDVGKDRSVSNKTDTFELKNDKYSANTVLSFNRQRKGRKRKITTQETKTTSQKQLKTKKHRSVAEKVLKTIEENRLTRASKRSESKVLEIKNQAYQNIKKPVKKACKKKCRKRGRKTCTKPVIANQKINLNKPGFAKQENDMNIESARVTTANKVGRNAKQVKVDSDSVKSSLDTKTFAENSEIGLNKEKEVLKSVTYNRCTKKRVREKNHSASDRLALNLNRGKQCDLMAEQKELHVSECFVRLKRIKLLDDAVSS